MSSFSLVVQAGFILAVAACFSDSLADDSEQHEDSAHKLELRLAFVAKDGSTELSCRVVNQDADDVLISDVWSVDWKIDGRQPVDDEGATRVTFLGGGTGHRIEHRPRYVLLQSPDASRPENAELSKTYALDIDSHRGDFDVEVRVSLSVVENDGGTLKAQHVTLSSRKTIRR
jgi:hypothetical protein